MRSVSQVVKTTFTGRFNRVIGTTDLKGQGTSHPLADVNPFVLLDDPPTISKKGLPPFGMHPHAGLQVLSIAMSGFISQKLGSEDPDAPPAMIGPGPFCTSVKAGRGVCHDESTGTDDPTKMFQMVWLTPEEHRADACEYEEALSPPWVEQDGGKVRIMLCAGSLGDVTSKITSPRRLMVLYAELAPGGTLEVPTPAGGGFVYAVEGGVAVSGTVVGQQEVAVLEQAGGALSVAHHEGAAKIVIGVGERIEEPWVKLLFSNGFLLARDAEAADAKVKEFERDGPAKFGAA
eukprot:CAMPEP_0182875502 /NCGR_PEP_ID=MMETSP0034_2-20130328/13578_1 /TAXON_ID=156128 /ORGANISM="Nephroselmis pyriformis, Strain CCMP717" /LENGTH=289 /DNA_ID=CAMNT_0025008241 /DNA_START=108 /DNA_END=977 /DNA_ORIENTATION=+